MTSKKIGSGVGQRGFSVSELLVVVSVIGILTAASVPTFISYYQLARLRAGAEQIAAFLNQGRQIGIKENVGVCVHITSTAMHYHVGSCVGPVWLGPGSDASGNVKAPQGITLTASADPVFNYVGAASPTATYTVRNTQTNRTMTVTVAASGRVSIGP
jgi:prepilin-type N-terminal cleavage/methylation domain-containing protein